MPCRIELIEQRTVVCDEPGCGWSNDTALTQIAAESMADDHEETHSGIFNEGEDA